MTWQVVAEKDVRDASRSKTIWLLFGLLSIVFVGFTAAYSYLGDDGFTEYLGGLQLLVAVFLPIIAILLGYKSVLYERESGSLYLTLSFPHSRRDLVIGKFVGRSIALLVPSLLALSIAGVVGVVLYGTDGALSYPLFLGATALFGTAFVGFAVGLSMSTTADRQITFAALGGYLLLVVLWSNLHSLLVLLLHRFDFEVLRDLPDWAVFAQLANPGESYAMLVRTAFDLAQEPVYTDAPVYVDWWTALLLLLAWSLVPLALGYYQFSRADL